MKCVLSSSILGGKQDFSPRQHVMEANSPADAPKTFPLRAMICYLFKKCTERVFPPSRPILCTPPPQSRPGGKQRPGRKGATLRETTQENSFGRKDPRQGGRSACLGS